MKHIATTILNFAQIGMGQYFAETKTGVIYKKIDEHYAIIFDVKTMIPFDDNLLVYDLPDFGKEER